MVKGPILGKYTVILYDRNGKQLCSIFIDSYKELYLDDGITRDEEINILGVTLKVGKLDPRPR